MSSVASDLVVVVEEDDHAAMDDRGRLGNIDAAAVLEIDEEHRWTPQPCSTAAACSYVKSRGALLRSRIAGGRRRRLR
jgi:hypothetical protein